MQQPTVAPASSNLQSLTILLIFLILILNQVLLLALIAVLLKKIRLLVRTTAHNYHYFVLFYIVSKIALCVLLQIKLAAGLPDNLKQVQQPAVEKVFENGLAFADCAIVELFLISFEHYLALSFSVLASPKIERVVRILMQGAQLATFFTLIVPLLLFNVNMLSHETLADFTTAVNCLSVVMFVVSFFFMSFKMAAVLADNKSTHMMKKVYALLLALLVCRLVMSILDVWVRMSVSDGSYEHFVKAIDQNHSKYVVLGLCFVMYLLIILLTQGLPLISSFRQSVINALTEPVRARSPRASSVEQSLLSEQVDIRQELFSNLEIPAEDDREVDRKRSKIVSNLISEVYHGLSKIETQDQLQMVEKIAAPNENYTSYKAKLSENGQFYFVKRIRNISNYIIEQVLQEINSLRNCSASVINPVKVIEQATDNTIYLVEKYLSQNLLAKMQSMLLSSPNDKIQLSLKILKAIAEFHEQLDAGHGAICPRNILFDEQDNIYLTGFGMEGLKKYQSLTADYSNITIYTAVELMGPPKNKTISRPNRSADVYSFGIIFYQLMTGNTVYRGLGVGEIKAKLRQGNSRPKIPGTVREDLASVMRKCWQEKPQFRPTVAEVLAELQRARIT